MKAVFNAWGKGKFDPRHNVDGIGNPVVIPPAYGLEGIHSVTFTGDGNTISHWNRYVAVAEMGGQGSVSEPRLNLSITNGTEDLVTSKLPALQAYQLSLKAPAAPAGSFDAAAAGRATLRREFLSLLGRKSGRPARQSIGCQSPNCMRRSSTPRTPGMFSAAMRAASLSASRWNTPT